MQIEDLSLAQSFDASDISVFFILSYARRLLSIPLGCVSTLPISLLSSYHCH